jgi:hypothetical protein
MLQMEFNMARQLCALVILLLSLDAFSQRKEAFNENHLLATNVFALSEVMLHDVASPPAASRFYAYSMLGAFEAAHLINSSIYNLNTSLNEAPDLRNIAVPTNADVTFCSIYAMLDVGRQIMPSGYLLAEKQKVFISSIKRAKRISEKSLKEQLQFSEAVSAAVVSYARKDNYNKLSTYTRYTPSKEEGHWYPTPPEYMAAVEPQWKTVRPFFIDSASQFAPLPPAQYSKDTTSEFFMQMKEVYELSSKLSAEQRAIASFWDCNPFAVTYSGHMAIGLKKISPGGHWMGITGIACKQANVPIDSSIFIHTVVAMTLHDAFISCWQEKYNSDRIRPEGVINRLLDSEWRPLLQTPPFPEYTSGHSVASASVATVLSHFFGNDFAYTDTSEIYFGLPARSFKSFHQAASEAAMSRLYGGIHFRDACEQGMLQGSKIGQFVLSSLQVSQP